MKCPVFTVLPSSVPFVRFLRPLSSRLFSRGSAASAGLRSPLPRCARSHPAVRERHPRRARPVHAFSLLALLLVGMLLPAAGFTADSSRVAYHMLPCQLEPGEDSRHWSAAWDLPEEELRRGRVFTGRRVFTSGNLEIVSESLVRNRYSVVLFLARGFESAGRGNLYLQLETGVPRKAAPLPAPGGLWLSSASLPFVIEAELTGTHLSAAVLDRSSGEICWQRLFSPNSVPVIDPGSLTIGRSYVLEVSQSDEGARNSPSSCLAFKVETRRESCPRCHGTGHRAERTADRQRADPCPDCRGAGAVIIPVPVIETGFPDVAGEVACAGVGTP